MRTFSSYGPVNTEQNFYVPRKALVDRITQQLLGDDPDTGGHYITVWAPRQRGKTWLMQQVAAQIDELGDFEVGIITMQSAQEVKDEQRVLQIFVDSLSSWFGRDFPSVQDWSDLLTLFTPKYFSKPLMLIVDEFDAIDGLFINRFVNEFRAIHTRQTNKSRTSRQEAKSMLHGLALIGVRSVLGIENESGSPFNVQRSIHIPNLTFDEVQELYGWYERESGQRIEAGVIKQIYAEFGGQPGLTSWLGELLTDTYNKEADKPLTTEHVERAILWATDGLGNANVQNIISKAAQEPHKRMVLELFRTEDKLQFRFDDATTNFLYLNGVVDIEETPNRLNVRFPCPFIQRRLFNYFASEIFPQMGQLYAPFEDLSNALTDTSLSVPNLLKVYERYLQQNKEWLLLEVPRKSNMRPYEAVFHFNLYMYLSLFFQRRNGMVYPEFPTGNGQIDLVIDYAGQRFGIEVKSFTDAYEYREGLKQAARYGKRLGLSEITLILFIEAIDDANREKFEAVYFDAATNTTVLPVFVVTGS